MPSFPSQKQWLPEAQRATYFLAYVARKRLTERQFWSLLWFNHLWWLWSPQRSYLGQVILFGDVPILELNMVARRFVGFCWQVYSPSWELEIICSQFYINFKAKILRGQIYQRKNLGTGCNGCCGTLSVSFLQDRGTGFTSCWDFWLMMDTTEAFSRNSSVRGCYLT